MTANILVSSDALNLLKISDLLPSTKSVNPKFYSSFIFITNMVIGLLTRNNIYSILFAILFLTSVAVHTHNYTAINLLDKLVIFLIFLYGGHRLYEKWDTSCWGAAFSLDSPEKLTFEGESHLLKISDLLPSYSKSVNLIKSCIILSTCVYVIWSYCYGYLTGDLCFYPNEEIAAIYHMFMHVVGSLGHNMIMLY
jgi:hypothetical protein